MAIFKSFFIAIKKRFSKDKRHRTVPTQVVSTNSRTDVSNADHNRTNVSNKGHNRKVIYKYNFAKSPNLYSEVNEQKIAEKRNISENRKQEKKTQSVKKCIKNAMNKRHGNELNINSKNVINTERKGLSDEVICKLNFNNKQEDECEEKRHSSKRIRSISKNGSKFGLNSPKDLIYSHNNSLSKVLNHKSKRHAKQNSFEMKTSETMEKISNTNRRNQSKTQNSVKEFDMISDRSTPSANLQKLSPKIITSNSKVSNEVSIPPINKKNVKKRVFESKMKNAMNYPMISDLFTSDCDSHDNCDNSCAKNGKIIHNDEHVISVSNIIPITCIDLKTAKCGICSDLVQHKVNISGCQHIFCSHCLQQWLKHSKHCPICRNRIYRYARNIRIGGSGQICVRSESDYQVVKVDYNADLFVDSYGTALSFEAFCLNDQSLRYIDSKMDNIFGRMSYLESISLLNRNQSNFAFIQTELKVGNQMLRELKEQKNAFEKRRKDISDEINSEMISFWITIIDKKRLKLIK